MMTPHDVFFLVLLALVFLFGADRDYHRHWLLRLATVTFVVAALIPPHDFNLSAVRLVLSAVAFVTFFVGAFVTGGIRISFRCSRKAG